MMVLNMDWKNHGRWLGLDMEYQIRRLRLGRGSVQGVGHLLAYVVGLETILMSGFEETRLWREFTARQEEWTRMKRVALESWDSHMVASWRSWEKDGVWRITPPCLREKEEEFSKNELEKNDWIVKVFGEEALGRLQITEDELCFQFSKKAWRDWEAQHKDEATGKDLRVRTMAAGIRVHHRILDGFHHKSRLLLDKIARLRRDLFTLEVRSFLSRFDPLLDQGLQWLTQLDLLLCHAHNARRFRLSRPSTRPSSQDDNDFLECKGLRHLIVERAQSHQEYITNDVVLTKNQKGILLYGQNSAGKCFLKGTKMVLWSGHQKKVEDLGWEDVLIGDDGERREIRSLTRGQGRMWEVVEDLTGQSLMIVNEEHILCLTDHGGGRVVMVRVADFLSNPKYQYFYTPARVVNQEKKKEKKDPWEYWRCDGDAADQALQAMNVLDISGLEEYLKPSDEDHDCHYKRPIGWKDSTWTRFYRLLLDHGRRVSFRETEIRWSRHPTHRCRIRLIPHGTGEFFGFGLSGNHRFLMPDGIVAHNSTLMKSLGVAVMMAQTGMYVPCDQMKWSPFHSLFTKIGSRDNIWKGHSTFVTEMHDLRHILQRSDPHSLILCDELTSGTETFSATGIVASTLRHLLDTQSSFILTTHLHTLARFKELMEDPRLAVKHIGMSYDPVGKKLLFDRILRPGIGRSVYGLEIAEYLGFPTDFLKQAYDYRTRLEEGGKAASQPLPLVKNRRSRYHPKVLMDQCQECGERSSTLHTHHIQEQSMADSEGYIGKYHKNSKFNLKVLCEPCQQKENPHA